MTPRADLLAAMLDSLAELQVCRDYARQLGRPVPTAALPVLTLPADLDQAVAVAEGWLAEQWAWVAALDGGPASLPPIDTPGRS
jgi:alpha-beta hydrolase superfamily lysophospholipase